MAKLIVNPTSASRREIQVPRSLYSIGRDPSNDLVLPDAMVSRRHAVIELRGQQYFLRDCNSSNGSLVNGDRVSEHALKDGDLVAIGTARLLFRDEAFSGEASAKVVPHPSAPHLRCRSCGAEHRVGDQFCRQCGGQLAPQITPKVVCPACATVVTLPAQFCAVCGAALGRTAGPLERTEPQEILDDSAGPPVEATPRPSPAAPPPVARTVSPSAGPPPALAAERSAHVPAPSYAPAPPRRAEFARPERTRLARRSEPAGFGLRLLAALIDGALVGTVQIFLISPIAYYWFMREVPSRLADVSYLPILLSALLLGAAALLGAFYYVYFWGISGATPGKRAMGLVIEDQQGHTPIGVSVALLRLFGYALSGAFLGIGFLMILFTGLGLHDRLAGTRVVRREDA